MINLSPLDLALVAVYFLVTFLLGILKKGSRDSSPENYILAGRKLTLPAFVATTVSTWYGGILGVGEFSYKYGLVNWVTQGLFYYIFAILFAVFFASKISKLSIFTIPDRLHEVYGKKTALAGSIFTFIMVSPAPYILVLGVLLQTFTGINLFIAILLGALFSTGYIMTGGFSSVIRTDILQFSLMFLGFLILVPMAIAKYGGISFLQANLPDTHLTFTGELGASYIIVWGLIAFWTFVDPGFYQRCLAAKSGKTAKKGLIISVGFWIVFDILTCSAGLYARAILPNIDPVMSYPLLADNLLPSVLKGLFFVGMLATVMSTIDSTTFLSAITIGNDFFARFKSAIPEETDVTLYTKIGLIITVIGGIATAWFFQSVIEIWYLLGTIGIPALFFPLVSSFSKNFRLKPRLAFLSITLSPFVSLVWVFIGYMNIAGGFPSYPLGIEPMYPGFTVSIIIFIINYIKVSKN